MIPFRTSAKFLGDFHFFCLRKKIFSITLFLKNEYFPNSFKEGNDQHRLAGGDKTST
jgi:hypothetical protein